MEGAREAMRKGEDRWSGRQNMARRKRGEEWEKGQMERVEQHRVMSEGRLSWYLLTSSSGISCYLLFIVFRLKISTLMFDDAGLYMCTGENPFGETSVTGALAVLPSRLFQLPHEHINVFGIQYNIFSTTVNVILPCGCQGKSLCDNIWFLFLLK